MADAEVLVEAAVSGLGLAQVFDRQVRAAITARNLKPILGSVARPEVELRIEWPLTRQFSPSVRHVVDRFALFVEEDGR